MRCPPLAQHKDDHELSRPRPVLCFGGQDCASMLEPAAVRARPILWG